MDTGTPAWIQAEAYLIRLNRARGLPAALRTLGGYRVHPRRGSTGHQGPPQTEQPFSPPGPLTPIRVGGSFRELRIPYTLP